MRTTVVIDYPDACLRARGAFGVDVRESQIDPVSCAEQLVRRSRVSERAVLERIVVHHALPERQFDGDGFRREQQRVKRWRASDPRVVTQIRSLRVPRHAPEKEAEAKAVASAVALDASFLLERGESDHVLVFSHRRELQALTDWVHARWHPQTPGLEYGSWRSEKFRITVPGFGPLGNVTLHDRHFDACREYEPSGSEQ